MDHVDHTSHMGHIDHIDHVDHIDHIGNIDHTDHIAHINWDHTNHTDHRDHVDPLSLVMVPCAGSMLYRYEPGGKCVLSIGHSNDMAFSLTAAASFVGHADQIDQRYDRCGRSGAPTCFRGSFLFRRGLLLIHPSKPISDLEYLVNWKCFSDEHDERTHGVRYIKH